MRNASIAPFALALLVWLLPALAQAGSVAPSAELARPLDVGDTAPSAACRDVDGKPVALDAYVGREPVALIFYRGGW